MNIIPVIFDGGRGDWKSLLFVKAAVGGPSAVPKLKKDGGPFGMNCIHDHFPGFGLFIRIDSWGI
jgi:hypothetical protein